MSKDFAKNPGKSGDNIHDFALKAVAGPKSPPSSLDDFYEGLASAGFESYHNTQGAEYRPRPELGEGLFERYKFRNDFEILYGKLKLTRDISLTYRLNEKFIVFNSISAHNTQCGCCAGCDRNSAPPNIIIRHSELFKGIHMRKDVDYCFIIVIIKEHYYKPQRKFYNADEPISLEQVMKNISGELNPSVICPIFMQMHNFTGKGLSKLLFLESKILELLSTFQNSEQQKSLRTLHTGNKNEQQLIEKAREVLTANYASPPTIERLAQMTTLNTFKLKTYFKQHYNTTINSYMQKLRMDNAMLMLNNSSHHISEIARTVGYASTGKFSAAFCRHFGVLPSQYRNSRLTSSDNS